MRSRIRFLLLSSYVCVLAFAIDMMGCAPTGLSGNNDPVDTTVTDQTDDGQSDGSASKSYVSTRGTAGLGIGTNDTGVATIASFNPGAFVQATASTADGFALDSFPGAAREVQSPPPTPPLSPELLPFQFQSVLSTAGQPASSEPQPPPQ